MPAGGLAGRRRSPEVPAAHAPQGRHLKSQAARASPTGLSVRDPGDHACAMGYVSLPVRLARTLHSRWLRLGPADRMRLAPLARDARDRALDLRGTADREQAERELKSANESLAAAIVASAEADPEVGEDEVRGLRSDLRRELDRLALAEVKATKTTSREPAQ